MSPDPADVPEKTARIPAKCTAVLLTPAFGGGFIIQFQLSGGVLDESSTITAPVGVTFHPDGRITWPDPLGSFDFN